jgi:FkbM family methyltransferase
MNNNEFNRLAQTRYGPLLYNRFDQYVGGSIAAYGEFSEGEAAMFGQLVGTGGVVVEAGANIGAHTVHLAKRVGETGAVYAFEPQRIVFQTLCANLALNQLVNVIARQQGCGRQAGEMVLPNVDPRAINNFGGLSLLTEGRGEKVEIVTIDSLELTRCNLIKVDVEGMEEEVIAGAVNTIARLRPVLYLENDRTEKSASLIRYLQSLDYRIWWHLSPLFNTDNFAKNSNNIFGNIVSINILCQPAETARPVAGLREITDANEKWDQQSGLTTDGQ